MKRGATLMLALLMLLCLTACGNSGVKASDGLGEGRIGDTMKTYFFNYKVNSAYVADSYEGYTPESGKQVLVANVTVTNTFGDSIEMYDNDFWLEWGEEEDSFAWAITSDDEGNELETYSDAQIPYIYRLADKEERTGDLVFDVPSDLKVEEASLWYLEMFDDGTEEGSTGDYFVVDLVEK